MSEQNRDHFAYDADIAFQKDQEERFSHLSIIYGSLAYKSALALSSAGLVYCFQLIQDYTGQKSFALVDVMIDAMYLFIASVIVALGGIAATYHNGSFLYYAANTRRRISENRSRMHSNVARAAQFRSMIAEAEDGYFTLSEADRSNLANAAEAMNAEVKTLEEWNIDRGPKADRQDKLGDLFAWISIICGYLSLAIFVVAVIYAIHSVDAHNAGLLLASPNTSP